VYVCFPSHVLKLLSYKKKWDICTEWVRNYSKRIYCSIVIFWTNLHVDSKCRFQMWIINCDFKCRLTNYDYKSRLQMSITNVDCKCQLQMSISNVDFKHCSRLQTLITIDNFRLPPRFLKQMHTFVRDHSKST